MTGLRPDSTRDGVPARPPRERPRRARSAEPEPREGVRVFVTDNGASIGLRESGDGELTLFGHFTPFDRWTEIDSFFEGRFMERSVKGAFRKTIRENRDQMRVLFNHGRDPQLANKIIGPIRELREEDFGPYYEVGLGAAPRTFIEDVLPGVREGLYGASYRFRVMREERVENPDPSESNPLGLEERTIKEAQVIEFGPVSFPAYADATAGVRSATDEYYLEGLALGDPECVRMAAEGTTFRELIGHRMGIVVPDLSALRSSDEEDETAGEHGRAPADRTPDDDAATSGERVIEPEPDKSTKKAAPGPSPTPLLGVRKEPWRL